MMSTLNQEWENYVAIYKTQFENLIKYTEIKHCICANVRKKCCKVINMRSITCFERVKED